MRIDYPDSALDDLRAKDSKLGAVIDALGRVDREAKPDVFRALVEAIVGQQVSGAVQRTVVARLEARLGAIAPDLVCAAGAEAVRACGTSARKAGYILDLAGRVASGQFPLGTLASMDDAEVLAALTALRGIGPWTAEMMMLFSLQRPDILSFGDFGIQRGMRMVYRHRTITPEAFRRIRRRLSPWGSVASLYFWAVAGGALPGVTDPAVRTGRQARR